MEIKEIVERVADIRNARPSANTRQRVQEAAQEVSRAGDMQTRVELANEALAAYAQLLYEFDADGVPANFDPKTWRLLVPAPWGQRGWRKWGMRQWEARILRSVLIERHSSTADMRPVLFDYSPESKTWHLNYADYPTFKEALFWLKHSAVSLAEWRKFVEITRAGTRNRMRRLYAQRKP